MNLVPNAAQVRALQRHRRWVTACYRSEDEDDAELGRLAIKLDAEAKADGTTRQADAEYGRAWNAAFTAEQQAARKAAGIV